jgi:hypothetical protein
VTVHVADTPEAVTRYNDLAAATGCSGTVSNGDTAAAGPKPVGGIATGPGPHRTYTVQSQPAAGSCHYRHNGGQPLPDSSCTPGAVSPDVTQATVTSTICRKGGYTSGIRPPVGITDKEKHANAASHGYTGPLHDADIGSHGYQYLRNEWSRRIV